ncbi:hypothetical protein OCV72_07530, partial [Dorea amylophila]
NYKEKISSGKHFHCVLCLSEAKGMDIMMYQTVLIENITTENVTEKINAKLIEMEKQSYKLVTMSFWGAEKVILVFKKGLKGSLL